MMHRTNSLLAAITAAVTLTACTTKESKPADTTAVDTGAAANATASTAAPNEVTITASEYKFDAPDSIPAGMTTFKLVNNGKQPHHASLFRLTEGHTYNDAMAGMRTMKPIEPPPSWIVPAGGPNAADPGGSSNATVNLEPGNYMFVCFIPDPKGAPHFTHGMTKGLTVTPATTVSAPAPTPDITVTLSDYKFDWSTPLTAGTHTIGVTTAAGGQPHEIQVFRLAPGKTQADLQGWLEQMMTGKPSSGPPPASALGGIAAIGTGQTEYFTGDFPAGDYVVMCFLDDAKDHKPHFIHGMIQTIKVT